MLGYYEKHRGDYNTPLYAIILTKVKVGSKFYFSFKHLIVKIFNFNLIITFKLHSIIQFYTIKLESRCDNYTQPIYLRYVILTNTVEFIVKDESASTVASIPF